MVRAAAAAAMVFGIGVCAYPVLGFRRRARGVGLMLLAIPILLAPLLVPMPATTLRFVVAVMSIAVGVKLYDLHRAMETGPRPGLWTFLTYLPNGCNLVLRRVAPPKRSSRRGDLVRILWLIPAAGTCAAVVVALWHVDWRMYPWALEHCVKVAAVGAFIQFGSNLVALNWRVMGVAAMDFSGWFFAAATPAEFWRRWNMPAGLILREYVFMPAGGPRRIFRATMATFALNGLVHEYVLGIAAGRILGWVVLFFLVQGVATAATMRMRPSGLGRRAGIVLTTTFNLMTSVLLFWCVDAVVPFYAVRGS